MVSRCVWGGMVIIASLLSSWPISAADLDHSWENGKQEGTNPPMISSQKNHSSRFPPAYDHRSRRHYQYFPAVRVYHDAERGLYFYPRGHEWRIAVSLPSELRVKLGHCVTFEIEGDKPYVFNAQHKKQYPPGR